MKRIADKAAEYLKLKNIDRVQHGDESLLHEIAEYCGIEHKAWKTSWQILNALDRAPDIFYKSWGNRPGRRMTRIFILVERL